MSAFLKEGRPTITLMLRATTMRELTEEIERGLQDGTDAFGLQLDGLDGSMRTSEHLKTIFQAMQGKPAYVTDYFKNNRMNCSDEAIAEELLRAVDCGAALIDIHADMFAPCDREYTDDPAAIEKQKALIREIHRSGGQVLMSSHVQERCGDGKRFCFQTAEEVLRIARSDEARGADIAKIVTNADTQAELDANCETTLRLKRELGIPFLFLCNGEMRYRHRRLSPVLGSSMVLVTESRRKGETQPPIDEMKAFLRSLNYTDLP